MTYLVGKLNHVPSLKLTANAPESIFRGEVLVSERVSQRPLKEQSPDIVDYKTLTKTIWSNFIATSHDRFFPKWWFSNREILLFQGNLAWLIFYNLDNLARNNSRRLKLGPNGRSEMKQSTGLIRLIGKQQSQIYLSKIQIQNHGYLSE